MKLGPKMAVLKGNLTLFFDGVSEILTANLGFHDSTPKNREVRMFIVKMLLNTVEKECDV